MINPRNINFLVLLLMIILTCCKKEAAFITNGEPIGDGNYYVATWGDDNNPGTFEQPWGTWQKAFETADAGDIVYFRGGVWKPATGYLGGNNAVFLAPYSELMATNTSPVGHSGTPGNPICFFAYPGETPILDGSQIIAKQPYPPNPGYNSAIQIQWANFIHLKGLVIRNFWQRGLYISCGGIGMWGGSNYTIENCTVHDVSGEAFTCYVGGGYSSYGNPGSIQYDTTRFINCDAFNCLDTINPMNGPGGWADGWKVNVTSVNDPDGYILFDGCRAWNCSDDGLDPGGAGLIEIKNCWIFNNGRLDGDGYAIKTGGSTTYESTFINRKIHNNLFAFNKIGVGIIEYPKYYRLNARVYNNTAFKNEIGYNFSINAERPAVLAVFVNNISFKDNFALSNAYQPYKEHHNVWDYVPGSYPGFIMTDTVTISADDFQSVIPFGLTAPRKKDGSLPDINFLKLAKGSDLINAGANVGLPGINDRPDLGAFESDW